MSSSTTAPSSSTSTPITFSGSSTFSSSFQQVITRAVALANAPIQLQQNHVTDLTSEATTVSQLNATFLSLQSALGSIAAASSGAASVQVTDPNTLNATASPTAMAGTYEVQVDSMGSSTTAMSTTGLTTVTDPTSQNISSSSSSFTLTVNGVTNTITPSGTSLNALTAALNSGNYGVQATIVNMGSSSTPDYRLSLTSTSLAPDTIQLSDGGGTSLMSTLSTGANLQYAVNGSTTEVSSSSSQITLSPGLTVNLLSATKTPVGIFVGPNASALGTALSNLATAYNNAVTAVQQQQGKTGGMLAGQSIVYEMSNVLQSISQYGSPGSSSQSVASLADLGLTVDQTGQMSFSSTAFSAGSMTAAESFLGSTDTSGFLYAANNQLNTLTDSNSGAFHVDSSNLQSQITSENTSIVNQQASVTQMQANLQAQLSAADAQIATLQSQTSYYQQLFQATYGNGTNSNG
jgi:flagellar hook-associated protein 2